MKPPELVTNIFLDSGDPHDTKKVMDTIGFLDGQTTNPSLIAQVLGEGKIYSNEELLTQYKNIVTLISKIIPNKSISIEVYSDDTTSSDDIVEQARVMNSWVAHSHIKIPCTTAGLEAAQILTSENIHVNITLVFTQEQAAAAYTATQGAPVGSVLVSPFEGRLDDENINGIKVVSNIQQMFDEKGDEHAQVLMASVRDLDHFYYALYLGIDSITAPLNILMEWYEDGMLVPGVDIPYDTFESQNEYLHAHSIIEIEYENLDLDNDWTTFDIAHPQTEKGLEKFADDWNELVDR